MQHLSFIRSDSDTIYRDPKVRMYHGWYTRGNVIRTFRDGFKRETLVAFTVIDNELQVIIKDIDGIDKGFYYMTAKKGICAVALGELLQEKDDAVTVDQLGLRKAESITADAQVFGGGFQLFQLFNGGG